MLILTRRVGESIIIAGNTTVTISQISTGQVKLAINAPLDVTVNREEIEIAKLANSAKK